MNWKRLVEFFAEGLQDRTQPPTSPPKSPSLNFDHKSQLSFELAKLFALNKGTSTVNALHLFKGIIHCGDQTVGRIFDRLKFEFNEETNQLNANASALSEKVKTTNLDYTAEVKKTLARAHRCAVRKARQEVVLLDLLQGLIEEAPRIVRQELSKKQLTFEMIQDLMDA